MATYQCPKGHTSTDPDYCSECGAPLGQSTVPSVISVPLAKPSPNADVCPDCMTPRTPGARFCEVCRYDFTAGTSGDQTAPVPAVSKDMAVAPPTPVVDSAPVLSAPAEASPLKPTTAATPTTGSTPATAPAQRLNVVVITDPSLVEDEEERKQCPQNAPDLVFPLDLEENLLGRRSDNKKIYPEVDVSDPGVSHRHLKFMRQADGSFAVLELGSANGTILNGVVLKPGLVTPIAVGDEMLLGIWTRLRIRGR